MLCVNFDVFRAVTGDAWIAPASLRGLLPDVEPVGGPPRRLPEDGTVRNDNGLPDMLKAFDRESFGQICPALTVVESN